jgi:hypothetical protein
MAQGIAPRSEDGHMCMLNCMAKEDARFYRAIQVLILGLANLINDELAQHFFNAETDNE